MSRWRRRKGLREATVGYTPLPQAGHWAGGHQLWWGQGRLLHSWTNSTQRAGRGPVETPGLKEGLANRIPMMMNEDTMSVLLHATATNHMWPLNN